GELLVGAVLFDDGQEMVALRSLFCALGSERNRSRHIDGESRRPGREARHVEATRAHPLDLAGMRLHRVVNSPLAGALSQEIGERLEHVLIDRRILDWG